MIQLDFNAAIAIFLILNISVVFGVWIFYTLKEQKRTPADAEEAMLQCSFCNYMFHHIGQDKIIICPRCQSYLTKEGL